MKTWEPGDPTPHQHLPQTWACFCDESDPSVCAHCGHAHITGGEDGNDGGCGTCECWKWDAPFLPIVMEVR